MSETNRQQWINLHKNKRYRPKYPSEIVVQFVFRNFSSDGKTKVLDLGCGAGRHVFFWEMKILYHMDLIFRTKELSIRKK